MLITEYKQKVIDLLRKHNYKEIVNQHQLLNQFTECDLFDDILYYLYCVDTIKHDVIIHTQHEFLYLLPSFISQHKKYIELATLEYRKYKIKNIISRV